MWQGIKRLALGIVLIAAAAATLLISDLRQRQRGRGALPRIALLTYSSRPILDEVVQGQLDALNKGGFVDGRSAHITVFNAQNDMPTANAIAKEMASGRFDMILTASTPCLQAVANANKAGKVIHVFAAVTDPYGAGVGITGEKAADHPRYLVGIGTFQPVKRAYIIARQMFPQLKVMGAVWNPSEACSQACMVHARAICKELHIKLLEATVDNSAAVLEAAESLVSRGVQALWTGGDNTVEMAMDSLVRAGRKGRIPVFGNAPGHADSGAIFGLGANYYDVGVISGQLAVRILNGLDPATVEIKNCVPEQLAFNLLALKGLNDPWRVPKKLLDAADYFIDADGKHIKKAAAPKPKRHWKAALVSYVNSPFSDESERGLVAGLKSAGLGDQVEVERFCAQGDVATLSSIMDSLKGRPLDLLMVISTPTLQAAARRFRKLPIVFTCVADGVAAGCGKTSEDHQPNVTGIATISAFGDMAKLVRECLPQAKAVGTLFVPAETNSVFYKNCMVKAMKQVGIEVVAVGVNSNTDVPEAAMSLCAKDIDVICQISDNLTGACFPAIESAARRSKMPIFCYHSSQARSGAVVALARDYFKAAQEAGEVATRVLQGANPRDIPFRPASGATLLVNLKAAKDIGFTIPAAVVNRADEVIR